MTRELELQFQELSIRTLLAQMDEIFHLLRDTEDNPLIDTDFSTKEIRLQKKNEFLHFADRVYNLCIAYLEFKNLPVYITKFDQKLLPLYAERDKLLDNAYIDLYGGEENMLTRTCREFLFSFRAFGKGEYYTGLNYLENILESTSLILGELSVIPSKEQEVYDKVRIVCKAAFHDAQCPGGHNSFNKEAKCYKPDILIPMLNCAIEYKFAETEVELNTTMDEILADVEGYNGNPLYKLFYAVFYVKTGTVTKSRFDTMWNTKNFPENWKPFLVQGAVNPSKKKAAKNGKTKK